MTPQRLAVIAVLAVLAVGGALWIAAQRSLERDTPSALLYPALRTQLDDVERIRIYGPGDDLAVTIDRDAGAWRVLERGGYAADTARLRALLRNLAEARLIEEKTSQPGNYAALGVQDLSTTGATGVRIALDGPTDGVDLIVGERDAARGGSYLRRSAEPTSWLADRTFDIPAEPGQWIDRSILDVSADRIQSASVEREDARYQAAKASRTASDFDVTGLPASRALSGTNAANPLATALLGLQADDVRPSAEFADREPQARATFQTFDGLVLDLRGYELDGQQYLTIEARADPELADRFRLPLGSDGAPSPAGATETGSAGTDNDAEAREAAERIDARTRGWAYAIPEYKYDAIFRPVEELLAPQPDTSAGE